MHAPWRHCDCHQQAAIFTAAAQWLNDCTGWEVRGLDPTAQHPHLPTSGTWSLLLPLTWCTKDFSYLILWSRERPISQIWTLPSSLGSVKKRVLQLCLLRKVWSISPQLKIGALWVMLHTPTAEALTKPSLYVFELCANCACSYRPDVLPLISTEINWHSTHSGKAYGLSATWETVAGCPSSKTLA